ncbi:MAG: hypothetical protein O3A63_17680 [Proteobacteria bacterium]|nr:hypothetical protein [Pseudomonadota bacterium]
MEYAWHDLVGNLGVAIILTTYALVQTGRMNMMAWGYSATNAVGSALIAGSLVFDFNLSAFTIELAWFLISCYGLVRVFSNRSVRPEAG